MTPDAPLLQPIKLGPLVLKNRIAVAPMTRISATEDGAATEEMGRHYARFAQGGFGLIITEGTYPDLSYSQGYLYQPGIATEDQAESWRPVIDAVHEAGAKIVLQLMHAGALSAYSSRDKSKSMVVQASVLMEDIMGMVKQDDGWRLPDELWEQMAPLLPPRKPHPLGCHNPRVPDRAAMNAIFFVLRTGCQWNALNATGICPSTSAYRRFREWLDAGVFE